MSYSYNYYCIQGSGPTDYAFIFINAIHQLQELLQNADDAGADTVRFIIDSRQHPRDPGGLWKPSLAAFQGPALLAWNNTVFSDADWRNIGKMHQSVKEEDVLKVGRFGLGFQSVHHLTGLSMSYAVGSLYIVECMY